MIVLAGGIGSGKSVVARFLRLNGFGVYDCDFHARRLMETDMDLMRKMRSLAGEKVYAEDGKLDRRMLAGLLFRDADLRGAVNEAVHAAVRRDVESWLAEAPENVFVESAISARSGLIDMAEEVWVVEASLETRMKRVMTRDNRPEEEIIRIMEAQSEEERLLAAKGSDIVRIANDPSSSLMTQILPLLAGLRRAV